MKFLSPLLLVLAACALTSRSTPVEVRYFTPTSSPAAAAPPTSTCPRLRLGRIHASDHLRYRIAHRRSHVELELYEALRWTERPDDYARRAIAQVLFTERGFQRAIGEQSPILDVEVTAFEEVERGPRRSGRVELRYELVTDTDVLDRGTITVERDAATIGIERVVDAVGQALTAAAAQLGDRVAAQLCR